MSFNASGVQERYSDWEQGLSSKMLVEKARTVPAKLRRLGWTKMRALAAVAGVALILLLLSSTRSTTSSSSLSSHPTTSTAIDVTSHPLHVLIPSTKSDPNLCKTLLTLSVLGYSTPVLLAWNETFDNPGLAGGGAMIPAKVYRVLEYLDSLPANADDDLVLLIDAYDIWFQLPVSVLLSRYVELNAAANARLKAQFGNAYEAEHIRQTIIWGQQKLAEPNEAHTIAWYPIPESPLPADTYGGNTDTPIGRSRFSSFRPRYLNSGYAIGSVGSLRALWTRVKEWYEEHAESSENQNGSGNSAFMYYGADNAIFNEVWGEQEYARELSRLRHLGWIDRLLHRNASPRGGSINGVHFPNTLSPPFTHQKWTPTLGKNYEFGIGVDYASDLGHQTEESVADARWLVHNGSLQEQITGRNAFDCKLRLPQSVPEDVLQQGQPYNLTSPLSPKARQNGGDIDERSLRNVLDPNAVAEGRQPNPLPTWTSVQLYTHLCYGTVPVMVHYDGQPNKHLREDWWANLWLQPHARALLSIAKARAANVDDVLRVEVYEDFIAQPKWGSRGEVGVWTDKREYVGWDELCPARWDARVFGDV